MDAYPCEVINLICKVINDVKNLFPLRCFTFVLFWPLPLIVENFLMFDGPWLILV